MSLFCGIYSRSDFPGGRLAPPGTAIREVVEMLAGRHGTYQTFELPGFFLAKIDTGVFGEPGILATGESLTAVAGEPLLDPSPGVAPSRLRDVGRLAERFGRDDISALRACQGSYTICHYNGRTGRLLLAVDKLGVRPLYVHVGDEHIFFSGSLRILNAISRVPKRMDVRGVSEEAAFGFPLGDRTAYADIRCLLSGEYLECQPGREAKRSRYYVIEDVQQATMSRDEFLNEAFVRFQAAVADRSARSEHAWCFLSGGLDSRCIAATLTSLGKRLTALTYDVPGSPDRELAERFARLIESRLFVRTKDPEKAPQEMLRLDDVWASTTDGEGGVPHRLVFSGDGGSVGVGCVYMDGPLVELLRAGRQVQAVDAFLKHSALPRRLFRSSQRSRICDLPRHGVIEELKKIGTPDPAKAFYFFLMKNDQRRHLHAFLHEDGEDRGVDFLLPFFDGRFLDHMASCPLDWLLRHELYHDWLSRFPPRTTQIPWQTYPGHIPCPVEGKVGRTQWDRTRAEHLEANRHIHKLAGEALRQVPFPYSMMRKSVIRVARVLETVGCVNYSYYMSAAVKFAKYYKDCDGVVAEF